MAAIVPAVLLTRAAVLAIALAAVALFPLNEARCLDCRPSGVPWLDAFARWDGRWYVAIAENGYDVRDGQSELAFFPLYPTLVRAVALPLGADPAALVAAGLIVSFAATAAAVAYILRLARLDADAEAARRAAWYVLLYPSTILLSVVYAESLFLALGAAAFWYARAGRWQVAGPLAALAALTRPFGVVVALALAVELWAAHREARARYAPWAWLSLAPVALAAWSAYLFSLTGRPLAVLEAHAAWSVRPGNALSAVGDLFDERVYGFPWIVAALLVLMIVLTAHAWRIRASYGAYCTLMLAAMISPGTLTSSMRHELGMFPAFIALGVLGARPWVHWTYVTAGGAIALVFAAMFALSHWIG